MLLLLLSRFSRVWLCATPWTAAHQAPPSMGFSRQEYWSGVPLPSPGKRWALCFQVAPCLNMGITFSFVEKTASFGCKIVIIPNDFHKEPAYLCRRRKRCGFDSWVGKIPWRRAWQPTGVFLLESPMDGEAWQATVHRVAQSQTRLKRVSTHTHALYEEVF